MVVLRNRRVGHRQAALGKHFAQAWQGLLEGIARLGVLRTEPEAHLGIVQRDSHFERPEVFRMQLQPHFADTLPGEGDQPLAEFLLPARRPELLLDAVPRGFQRRGGQIVRQRALRSQRRLPRQRARV